MESLKTYIEKINVEIRNHIAEELANGVTRQNEHDLCTLFKNRKYAMDMLDEKEAMSGVMHGAVLKPNAAVR